MVPHGGSSAAGDGSGAAFGDHTAVDRVSFQIAPGETYGLLGPNGAGKTTTISMIAGLLTPDSGIGRTLGAPLTGARKSPWIGLVPQDIALYPDLSALENLQFFGKLQNLHGAHLKDRIARPGCRGARRPGEGPHRDLLGGMTRRANIAVGLLHEPQLLIARRTDSRCGRTSIPGGRRALSSFRHMAVLYDALHGGGRAVCATGWGIIGSGRLIAEGRALN